MSEATLTPEQALLEKVKKACNVVGTDLYNDELTDLIGACRRELKTEGNTQWDSMTDPLILRVIKLYCRRNFRTPPDYDNLLRAETALRIKMKTATGYTEWTGGGGADDAW